MSTRFGHDFSQVRIHTDAQAARSAEALGANAYALGGDIVFGPGQYQPGSLETERLLAHELTHVVQQARFGIGDPGRTSDRDDASEREADAAAGAIAAGRDARVGAAPGATLARDAKDDQQARLALLRANPMLAQFVGMATPAPVDPWAGAAQTPARPRDEAASGSVSGGWLSGAGGPVTDAYSLDDARQVAGAIQGVEEDAKESVEWRLKLAHSATSWVADKTHDIPIVGPLAGLGKSEVDNTAEFLGGAELEATDAAFGLASAVADPFDAARGVLNTVEHAPIAPGVFNLPKNVHGLINVATGDQSWGEFKDGLDPVASEKEKLAFSADQQLASCKEDVSRGDYFRCAGRIGFDIGSAFLPGGEAGALEREGVAGGKGLKALPEGRIPLAPEMEGVDTAGPAPHSGGDMAPKPDPMGPAHSYAEFSRLKKMYHALEEDGGTIESVLKTGRLPENYVTKVEAGAAGWEPGRALNNHLPGKQIGGDVFNNLPPGPRHGPCRP